MSPSRPGAGAGGGATGVSLDASLNWRPGREAASHTVYLSTDRQAVTDGTAPAETVADHSFSPSSLQFGTTYYWRVDEVNDAATPKSWAGDVWSFSTQEYAVVDDFESYDDDDNRIYDTWLDGVVNSNGSTVGYFQAPFAERTIVHGGSQSMPFEYNNVKTPYYSEAEREFSSTQNWARNGADSLSLWVRGLPAAFVEEAGVVTMSGAATISGILPMTSASPASRSPATARSWSRWRASSIPTPGPRPA